MLILALLLLGACTQKRYEMLKSPCARHEVQPLYLQLELGGFGTIKASPSLPVASFHRVGVSTLWEHHGIGVDALIRLAEARTLQREW
ncbi:hypothetical protein ACFOPX_08270 [Helicobacter baculiformis]|uniref:Lipoprotein n=1 Tax=Helicobacter baculiformis TaxID=427351 RepID=A0ABV7ZK35_9HELI|nr:hypothetical protein [Helicobacter baculiformis]